MLHKSFNNSLNVDNALANGNADLLCVDVLCVTVNDSVDNALKHLDLVLTLSNSLVLIVLAALNVACAEYVTAIVVDSKAGGVAHSHDLLKTFCCEREGSVRLDCNRYVVLSCRLENKTESLLKSLVCILDAHVSRLVTVTGMNHGNACGSRPLDSADTRFNRSGVGNKASAKRPKTGNTLEAILFLESYKVFGIVLFNVDVGTPLSNCLSLEILEADVSDGVKASFKLIFSEKNRSASNFYHNVPPFCRFAAQQIFFKFIIFPEGILTRFKIVRQATYTSRARSLYKAEC